MLRKCRRACRRACWRCPCPRTVLVLRESICFCCQQRQAPGATVCPSARLDDTHRLQRCDGVRGHHWQPGIERVRGGGTSFCLFCANRIPACLNTTAGRDAAMGGLLPFRITRTTCCTAKTGGGTLSGSHRQIHEYVIAQLTTHLKVGAWQAFRRSKYTLILSPEIVVGVRECLQGECGNYRPQLLQKDKKWLMYAEYKLCD